MILPRVLILAGGFGTRLASVVKDTPKPMAPIAGRPFLEYQIEYLKNQGFTRFTLLTGYLSEVIENHFGDGSRFGLEIDYSVEKEPLGTGGAIRLAMLKNPGDRFLVLNGDGLFATDYRRFVRLSEGPLSLALKYSTELDRYGSVEIDKHFKVTQFREKSPVLKEGYINAGAYLITAEALNLLPEGKSSIETMVFQPLAQEKILSGIPCGGKFVDIGTPDSFGWSQSHLPGWLKEEFKPCLFLDRDGVLIKNKNYLHKTEDVVIVPEVLDLIRETRKRGWYTVVVTNQSGVARGLYTKEDCDLVHRHIDAELARENLSVDLWFACYDHPDNASLLRKPAPGMVLSACNQLPIDLSKSLMIGDNCTDQIELPDLRTLLVQGDYEHKYVYPRSTVVKSHAELKDVGLKLIR
jgi:histidinol-phosphate phosphatase family protein